MLSYAACQGKQKPPVAYLRIGALQNLTPIKRQGVCYGSVQPREPWNKGKLVGLKLPLKLKDIWAIRIQLQFGKRVRDLALFDRAIDSKLRGCDLVMESGGMRLAALESDT